MTAAPEGDVAVLIGAGPGLGAALARRFAAGGFRLALIGRREQAVEAQAQTLRDEGYDAVAIAADAGNEPQLRSALQRIADTLGAPRVLLYNAAAIRQMPALEASADVVRGDLDVDVLGALVAVQELLPGMKAAGRGTVLLTGGGLADNPSAAVLSLSLGKAALRALGTCLAQELTAEHIQVCSVTISGAIGADEGFQPDAIAEHYWRLHQRSPGDWTADSDYEAASPG